MKKKQTDWQLTCELRWYAIYEADFDGHPIVKTKVLQQKRICFKTGKEEWISVPYFN